MQKGSEKFMMGGGGDSRREGEKKQNKNTEVMNMMNMECVFPVI